MRVALAVPWIYFSAVSSLTLSSWLFLWWIWFSSLILSFSNFNLICEFSSSYSYFLCSLAWLLILYSWSATKILVWFRYWACFYSISNNNWWFFEDKWATYWLFSSSNFWYFCSFWVLSDSKIYLASRIYWLRLSFYDLNPWFSYFSFSISLVF